MSDEPLVFAVIDDDASMRRLIGAIVTSMGDSVVERGTFAEGEVLLREYPWDIALIDRGLPDGDGIELCRAARHTAADSHRHAVIITAAGSHDERIGGFDAGADEYIVKPMEPMELRARLRAIRRAAATHKLLLARLATLEQISMIDGLTQVYNHRFFGSELRRTAAVAVRHRRPLALMMIDIDHFKQVNDTWGHTAGDAVLVEVSTAIAQSVRSSEIVARYGGEEFAVILPETTLREAVDVAERLREAVSRCTTRHGSDELRVTVSVGVAAMPARGIDSAPALLEAADRALYLAKSRGRNRVEIHEPEQAAKPMVWSEVAYER